MARKEIIELIDDRDGGPADQTVDFTWNGVDYQIDLSDKNVDKFDGQMKPWIDAATRKPRLGRPKKRQTRIPTVVIEQDTEAEPAKRKSFGTLKRLTNGNGKNGKNGDTGKPTEGEMRAWAIANGMTVNARGRLTEDIKKAWRAAHRKQKVSS